MRIVHADDVPFKERLPRHRDGLFLQRILVEGKQGTPSNFAFLAVRTHGDLFSPRHRHNFEQYRIQLEGFLDFDRNGKLEAGGAGYFPEGVFYGPQSCTEDCHTLVLQFGGASGHGYLTRAQTAAGAEELQKLGEFKGGVFTRVDEQGHKYNKDGYQAIWEHVSGRPLKYPEPRYRDPILMNPASFDWVPSKTERGVAHRDLGVFGERRASMGFIRVDAGATADLAGNGIYYAMSGSGNLGESAWKRETTIYLELGESLKLVADEPAELLHLGLPDLSGLEIRALEQAAAS